MHLFQLTFINLKSVSTLISIVYGNKSLVNQPHVRVTRVVAFNLLCVFFLISKLFEQIKKKKSMTNKNSFEI